MSKLRDKMARVKSQLASKQEPVSVNLDPKTTKAMAIGFAYEKILGEYLHQPTLKYFTKIGERGITPRTMALLRKAATIAEKHNIDPETYVRAQFFWFHQWFRRPPKINNLCGTEGKFPATRRVSEYLKLHKGKQVYSFELPALHEMDAEKLDRINRQRLKQLAETWDKPHNEILRIFAPAGVFDAEWLKKQPM